MILRLTLPTYHREQKKLKKHSDSNFTNFVTFQIDNSLEEERIKKTIPSLTEIDDSISTLVREMYEENPYPRGVEPIIIDKKLIDKQTIQYFVRWVRYRFSSFSICTTISKIAIYRR